MLQLLQLLVSITSEEKSSVPCKGGNISFAIAHKTMLLVVVLMGLVSANILLLLPLLVIGQYQSPNDLALGQYTREDIEEIFQLKKGSLVIPSDGDAFENSLEESAWSNYTKIALQLDDSVSLIDRRNLEPNDDLKILYRHESGLYYQEDIFGNESGCFMSVVGISGNQIVGCQYDNIVDPPSPLVPKGTDTLPCNGPFLANLNPDTCVWG